MRSPLALLARIAVVLLVCAGSVAAGRLAEKYVRASPAFGITTIDVEGNSRLTPEAVIEAAGLTLGQNVFEVGPEDAKARLLAHPYLASAEVTRRLPGTFTISVREHEPVAIVALRQMYLVSAEGLVFKRVDANDPVDLPVVTGLDGERFARDEAYRTATMLEVVAVMHEYRGVGLLRREPISELHVESDGTLAMYVGADSTYVRLGRGPYRTKLRRLRQVFDRLVSREARPRYVYLDNVRRPDRVTVRLR